MRSKSQTLSDGRPIRTSAPPVKCSMTLADAITARLSGMLVMSNSERPRRQPRPFSFSPTSSLIHFISFPPFPSPQVEYSHYKPGEKLRCVIPRNRRPSENIQNSSPVIFLEWPTNSPPPPPSTFPIPQADNWYLTLMYICICQKAQPCAKQY